MDDSFRGDGGRVPSVTSVTRPCGHAANRNRCPSRRLAPALILFGSFLLLPSLVAAQTVSVTFPFEGHYREGRYMPVRVTVSGADARAASVTISADGALPTVLPVSGGKADAVVPWLSLRGSIRNAAWSLLDPAGAALSEGPVTAKLKPLADDEGLVGYATGDARDAVLAAAELLPGRRVVPVPLNPARPLSPAPALCSLDLVLLDAGAASAVSESQVATLLAAGTNVALRSGVDQKPRDEWPWRREGAWWVLAYSPVGPRSPIEMQAYDPTYGWEHGWPAAVRHRAVLLAALTGIGLLAVSLWRSWYAAPAGAALALSAAAGIIAWSARLSPVLSAGGALVVWDGEVAQRDLWSYRTTLRDADTAIPWQSERVVAAGAPATRPAGATQPAAAAAPPVVSTPYFATRDQVRQQAVRLLCLPDGQPDRFVARLGTDTTLAVLSRSVSPVKPAVRPAVRVTPVTPGSGPESKDAGSALTSPLYVLAYPLYPGNVSGIVIEDDRRETPGEWQTIFIDNESK